MINNGHAPAQHLHASQMCTRRVWALSGNFHSLPQFALNPDKMRVLVAVFMLTLSLGYSFRVEDVFDIFQAGINILPQNEMIMDPTRPTGHEAPALLKHHSSASFIRIIHH